jgi:hypothetical protein
LDSLCSTLRELESRSLGNGRPAFLFRGERQVYSNTYSSLDRLYHSPDVGPDVYSELEDVAAFCMTMPLGTKLPPKHAGAFAQHYGFPTHVFDFTASVSVAENFAANRAIHRRPWPRTGAIGVLDVAAAEASGAVALFDLRDFQAAARARRQHAFGLIYQAFDAHDEVDLKRSDISGNIGLEWRHFGHLPDDETYLFLTGNDTNLESADGDEAANIPHFVVEEFVARRGPLSDAAASILATILYKVDGARREAITRWTA